MARRIPGGRGVATVPSTGRARVRHGELPDRETLIEWLRNNPGESSKRDIAKAFGIKGDDRVILKILLRELAAEGALRKEGSKLIAPGGLPPVCALDIFSRDGDGSLIARPAEWDEANGPPPVVTIALSTRERLPVHSWQALSRRSWRLYRPGHQEARQTRRRDPRRVSRIAHGRIAHRASRAQTGRTDC
jgi:hypothetical protein